MNHLPRGWATLTIAELGGMIGGKTPSKALASFWSGGTVPWVSPKDMKVFELATSEDTITEAAVSKAGMTLLPADTVLMVTRSGILAHTFPVAITSTRVTINQDIKAIKPSPGYLLPRYLAYNLKANGPTILARCAKAGTTVASVDSRSLEYYPFPLAPLPEQQRIADKLDTVLARVDTCRERLDRVPTLLRRFRQSVLTAALAGQFTGAAGYTRVAFGSLIASIRGGTTAVPQAQETEYPVLRSSSVRQGSIDFADVKYLTSDQSQIEENFIRSGDVLFTRLNGSVEYVGNCVVVPDVTDTKYQYPDRLYCARLKETILPAYCMYVFALPEIRAEIERRAKSSAGHKRISIQDIREMEVPLPTLAEQAEIVKRIESLFALASQLEDRLNNALTTMERITPALLAKAFRGELVPQDPNDEPAAELLKRLAKERLGEGRATKGTRAKHAAPVALNEG